VLGDGGIYSNVEDLARWDRALREHTPLSAAEMQAAFTPVKGSGDAKKEDGTPTTTASGGLLIRPAAENPRGTRARRRAFETFIERFTDEVNHHYFVQSRRLAAG
jgi:hypothetical protein